MTDQTVVTQNKDSFDTVRRMNAFAKWVSEQLRNIAVAGVLLYLTTLTSSVWLFVVSLTALVAIGVSIACQALMLTEAKVHLLGKLSRRWLKVVGFVFVLAFVLFALGASLGVGRVAQEIADAHIRR